MFKNAVVYVNGKIEVGEAETPEAAVQKAFLMLRQKLPESFREMKYQLQYHVEHKERDKNREYGGIYIAVVGKDGAISSDRMAYIHGIESWNTGGNCMVDVITLEDGTILSITDDVVVHHKSKDHFWGTAKDGTPVDNSKAPFIYLFDEYEPEIPESHDLPDDEIIQIVRFIDFEKVLTLGTFNSMSIRQAIISQAALAYAPQLKGPLSYEKAVCAEIVPEDNTRFRVTFTWTLSAENFTVVHNLSQGGE